MVPVFVHLYLQFGSVGIFIVQMETPEGKNEDQTIQTETRNLEVPIGSDS